MGLLKGSFTGERLTYQPNSPDLDATIVVARTDLDPVLIQIPGEGSLGVQHCDWGQRLWLLKVTASAWDGAGARNQRPEWWGKGVRLSMGQV